VSSPLRTIVCTAAVAASCTGAASATVPPAISPAAMAGARLGLRAPTYERLLGNPVRLDVGGSAALPQPRSYTRLVFPRRKVEVYFKGDGDRALEITTWNRAYRTVAGIGPCSPVTRLKAAYGRALHASRWSNRSEATYIYTLGRSLIFAAQDARTVSAVALYAGSLPYAAFIALKPDQIPCS
jgi:hypothetical protein